MKILAEPEPNVFLVDKLPGERQCISWSAEKGQLFTCAYAVTWLKSARDVSRWIISTEWEKLLVSRQAVSELCGLALRDVKYTYPSMARQVGDWLGVDQKPSPVPDLFLNNWHYMHCEPVQLEHGYMHDMIGAYWQFASKAPSLLCRIDYDKEKITWLNMTQQSEERWNRCKIALAPYKKLRLSIIGVNSTGLRRTAEQNWYHGGIADVMKGKPTTHFRNLALLTVRSAYEVTQLARKQLDGWYAVADCVLSEHDCVPYWDSLEIAYKTKGVGETETYGIAQWSCGKCLKCAGIGCFDCNFTGRNSTKPYELKRRLVERGHKLCLDETSGIDYERPVYHERLYT